MIVLLGRTLKFWVIAQKRGDCMAQRVNPTALIKRNSKHLKTSNDEENLKTSNLDKSLKTSNDDTTQILGKGAKKIPIRDRKKIFIEEYIRTLNATQSALKAGYSEKSARVQGSSLLTNPAIRAEIEKGMARRIDSCKVDTEFILQQLKDIALNQRCPYKDRVKALDLLGTYLNMWSGEMKTQPTTFTITLEEKN